jgi:hypothetical protein
VAFPCQIFSQIDDFALDISGQILRIKHEANFFEKCPTLIFRCLAPPIILALTTIKTYRGGDIMAILFIGVGLLIGIQVWFEQTGMSDEWADYQEQFHSKETREERKFVYEMFIDIE